MKAVFRRILTVFLIISMLLPAAALAAGYTLSLSEQSITLAPGESRKVTWSVTPVNLIDHSVTWASENSYVAGVDSKGKITAKAAGRTYIRATLETGATARVTVIVTGNAVTSLTLDKTELELEIGQTALLSYTMNDSADDRRVKWSSDNEKVAVVKDGKVRAVSGGIATVTLTAVNGMTASCAVYVPSEVTEIQLYPAESYLGIGASMELDPYVFPGNARNRALTFQSENEQVLTVDQNGVVTGVGEGIARVKASAANGVHAFSTFHVTLLPEYLLLLPTVIALDRQQSREIIPEIYPLSAEKCYLEWSSSDESVIKVNGGVLTSVGYGTATVTASALNGLSSSVTVNVCEPPESVRFAQSACMLEEGGEGMTLTPVFSPEGRLSSSLTYESSDERVARVSPDGAVTPVGTGRCTVTLTTAEGLSASIEVSVYERARALFVKNTSVTLEEDAYLDITVYSDEGKPYSGAVTGTSDDPAVCVFVNGRLYGRNAGTARVTFSCPGTALTCSVTATVTKGSRPVRAVALTFDNGPDAYTADILKVLDKYGVKATFFLLGSSIEGSRETAALLRDTQHEIGNHTYRNASISGAGVADTASDIEKTDNLILSTVGRSATLLRAPDARLPQSLLSSLLFTRRFAGRGLVMPDTGNLSVREISDYCLAKVYSSAVLTFHDSGAQTAASLETVIPALLEQGYRFVTVSEMIEGTGSEQKVFSTLPGTR